MYAIKDSQRGGYFTGWCGIGPMMGGTAEEAMRFDERMEAAMCASRFPMMVLWEIVDLTREEDR